MDDAADAFLRAGAIDACNGEVFNVGGDEPLSHRALTTMLVEVAGSGRVEYVEWPADKKAIDIGSFYADSTKFKRATGWSPAVSVREGLGRTVAFYRQHLDRYVDRAGSRRRSACDPAVARVPFLSLVPGDDRTEIRAAIDRVVASGWFVLGPEVEAFEAEFARAMGAAHAVGVGTGTDAIALILRALGIGPGDEVITTPLSAAYTALAIMMTGARPVFADVDPVRLTLDPDQVARGDRPADAGDSAGPPLRAGRRHGRARAHRRAAPSRDRRRLLPGAPRDGCEAARSARSASPARSASTRPRISARSATAARSSRTIARWRHGSGGCATAARPTAIITRKPA